MDEAATPGVRVAARDGGELSVNAQGVRIGEKLFALDRIQDARQVSPNPETIALRVAGSPLVEFRPAAQGDGRLALEAIYRLRPDLRPMGFEGPEVLPEGFPPLPVRLAPPIPFAQQYGGYAPMPPAGAGYLPPGYPPTGYPPQPPPGYPGMDRQGFPPPQGRYMPYPAANNPNRLTGEVTPYPRRFGEVLGAVFQLFGKYAPTLLALGLIVGFIPGALAGAIDLVIDDTLSGWGSSVTSVSSSLCTFPVYTAPPTNQLLRDAALFVGLIVLAAVSSAYATSTLAFAAREALLGRAPRVGASLAGGLRQLRAVLGTTSALLAMLCLLIVPGFVCLEIALPSLSGVTYCNYTGNGSTTFSTMGGVSLYLLGAGLLTGGSITFLWLFFRLAAAPYIAATQQIATRPALAASWHLTRGFFWKTLGLFVFLWMLTYLMGALLAAVTIAVNEPWESLFVLPLAQIIAAPLFALLWTTHIFDLRLRREGIAALREQPEALSEPPPVPESPRA